MKKNELKGYLNKFITGDALSTLEKMPDNAISLCITSPPYNTGGLFEKLKFNEKIPGKNWRSSCRSRESLENYKEKKEKSEDYISYQRKVIKEIMRILKEDGALFYNNKYRIKNGNLVEDLNHILRGFPVRQVIIWKKRGGFNFNTAFFLRTYEVFYLIAKPRFKLVPKSSSFGDVWYFEQMLNIKHPAAFPVQLTDRILKCTFPGVVLDPFMGSGTTALSCVKMKRDFIGIDQSKYFCDLSTKRIKGYHKYGRDIYTVQKDKFKRIPENLSLFN